MILVCVGVGCAISLVGVMLVLMFMFLGDYFLKRAKDKKEETLQELSKPLFSSTFLLNHTVQYVTDIHGHNLKDSLELIKGLSSPQEIKLHKILQGHCR